MLALPKQCIEVTETLWKTRIAPAATNDVGEAHTSETFGHSTSTGDLNIASESKKAKQNWVPVFSISSNS